MNNTASQSPLQQPLQPQSPTPTPSKTNTMAIISLVLVLFVPLVSFILALVAMHQIKKTGEQGKGLAIASLVISIVMGIISIGIIVALTATTFSGVQEKARDAEREVDIRAVHAQLEAYYAQNGSYPSLAELNDQSFRQKNLKGLDAAAVQTPNFSSSTFASKPSENSYSYEVVPFNCDGKTKLCTGYTLTAVLEDGTSFTKYDLGSSLFTD